MALHFAVLAPIFGIFTFGILDWLGVDAEQFICMIFWELFPLFILIPFVIVHNKKAKQRYLDRINGKDNDYDTQV